MQDRTVTNHPNHNPTDPNKALLILCSAAFLVPFMGSSLNLALPQIARDFQMNAVTLTWIATAYLISTAIFQIPFARIADIIGRRKVFISGVFIFSVCSLLSGFASSGAMLITLRFLTGIGSAMMFGTNIAIISSLFPPEKRGKALGVNAAVVYAALAAGPYFGGMLTQHFGWQSIFFTVAGVGIVVMALSILILKGDWIESRGEKFDVAGSILYGLSLAGIIYGFSTMPSASGFICLALGAAILLAFIRFEKRQAFPVFNVRLFSGNRTFTLSSVAALINYAATMGITFLISIYLQTIRGFDPSDAGLILICQALVQSVFSLVAGWLSNIFPPARLATTGMVLICIGLAGLLFLTAETPVWNFVWILALFGIGFGIFSSPNTNVIMGSVSGKDYSQASAVTGTMRLAGQSFSMGIVSMSISFMLGDQPLSPALFPSFMQAMRLSFGIFLGLCLVGVYASSVRVKAKH